MMVGPPPCDEAPLLEPEPGWLPPPPAEQESSKITGTIPDSERSLGAMTPLNAASCQNDHALRPVDIVGIVAAVLRVGAAVDQVGLGAAPPSKTPLTSSVASSFTVALAFGHGSRAIG
jgi:hypothetical protein